MISRPDEENFFRGVIIGLALSAVMWGLVLAVGSFAFSFME